MEKLITKSFKRLLDKGIHRGFITYEELGKSLGKRHFSIENIEQASLQVNSLLFPIMGAIAVILALQISIIARRR